MPQNYLETPTSGVAWVRCKEVTIDNTLGSPAVVRFVEEKVINLDGEFIHKFSPSSAMVFDPTATISLVDPATNLPTGETITHAEVYRILHSAYLQAAMARDAEEAE